MEQKKPEYFFTVAGLPESLNLLNYVQFFAPDTNYVDSFFWWQKRLK